MVKLTSQRISEAFGIGERELVAIVGGGGKTTLMYSLVSELSQKSSRVAAATTTKIFAPGPGDPVQLACGREVDELVAAVGEAVSNETSGKKPGKTSSKPLVLGGGVLPKNKVGGVEPAHCDALFNGGALDHLIVEADGARRKALKAPGPLEPVVPGSTTLFIAVVGLTCLGEALSDEVAFRPELVAEVTGLELGDRITVEALLSLLTDERGLLKGAPDGARMALLLNQADGASQKGAARQIASALLGGSSPWERVVIGHLKDEEPLEETWLR